MAAVVAASMVLGLAGCGGRGAGGGAIGRTNLNFRTDRIIYVHHAVEFGPVMFTDQAGNVWDERRYEPYGNEIDSPSSKSADQGTVFAQRALVRVRNPGPRDRFCAVRLVELNEGGRWIGLARRVRVRTQV